MSAVQRDAILLSDSFPAVQLEGTEVPPGPALDSREISWQLVVSDSARWIIGSARQKIFESQINRQVVDGEGRNDWNY